MRTLVIDDSSEMTFQTCVLKLHVRRIYGSLMADTIENVYLKMCST